MEIFKDIEGFEGYYQISNLGRIKALRRKVKSPIRHNKYVYKKERIRYATKNSLGYYNLKLYKKGIKRGFPLHRLLAIAFIPNPENKPFINHIDGNPSNNKIENLEWCTQSENIQHAYNIGRKKASWFFYLRQKGKDSPVSKPIIQLSKEGVEIKRWDCINDVQKQLGFNRPNICKVLKNKLNTAYGYKWKYQ